MTLQPRIFIFARDIQRHDAVGNFCRQMQALLQSNGWHASLAAENCHPGDRADIYRIEPAISGIEAHDIVFFHFSTEDPALPAIASLRNCKLLYYHGVTPERFFEHTDPRTTALVRGALGQQPLS